MDEFTGAVSHTMEHPLASESHAPRGATFFALANNAGAVGILANISIPSDSWRYLECDRVDILADQARVEIDGSRRDDGRVFRGGAVIEHIRLEIPWASLVQMASAQEVRIRVCNDVYRGDATFTAALGELARRMYAAEPTAAGAP